MYEASEFVAKNNETMFQSDSLSQLLQCSAHPVIQQLKSFVGSSSSSSSSSSTPSSFSSSYSSSSKQQQQQQRKASDSVGKSFGKQVFDNLCCGVSFLFVYLLQFHPQTVLNVFLCVCVRVCDVISWLLFSLLFGCVCMCDSNCS